MRTAQEIFTIVSTHLRRQKYKSSEPDGANHYTCLYHDPDGGRCAIGILISNTDYKPVYEHNSLDKLLELRLLPEHLHEEFWTHRRLLLDLQYMHDDMRIDKWEQRLRVLANRYSLQLP